MEFITTKYYTNERLAEKKYFITKYAKGFMKDIL